MELFHINVDPVPAKWWRRKVHRGWQFGYSGGTENDFMIDIEVAKWRFVCYIGFKKVQNWAPGYEKHLKWRKEQELARKRANRPEPAYQRFFRALRGIKTPRYRVDQKRTQKHKAPAYPGLELAPEFLLRLGKSQAHSDDEGRRELAAWPSLPEPIPGDAAPPFKGVVLYEEHQRPASDHHDQKEPEAGGLSREKTP